MGQDHSIGGLSLPLILFSGGKVKSVFTEPSNVDSRNPRLSQARPILAFIPSKLSKLHSFSDRTVLVVGCPIGSRRRWIHLSLLHSLEASEARAQRGSPGRLAIRLGGYELGQPFQPGQMGGLE